MKVSTALGSAARLRRSRPSPPARRPSRSLPSSPSPLAGFFSTWAATPSYAPLFSNLAGTDASAIVDELEADGVPYELADGGDTIMVPQDKVYDLRLKMSGAGLPRPRAAATRCWTSRAS